jgi:DNA polymerase-3 subunit beta
VRADGKTTKIKGIPASEFPLIPKLAKEGGYKIDAELLKQTIGQVAFAVSVSESRPELAGVACYFQGDVSGHDRCVMAATDSYRLSERVIPLLAGSGSQASKCIVPSRAMNEIGRILSAYKDEVTVPEQVEWTLADSQFVISYGNVELVSRLIEGSFPDYRQIIPTQFRTTATVARTELAKAIRAASLFSRQGLNDVHVEISPGKVTISSADTGTGTHTTELKADVTGDLNRVTLNFKYVTDGLNAAGADRMTIQMIDAMNPVVLRPADDQGGFQYIVMPIRQ